MIQPLKLHKGVGERSIVEATPEGEDETLTKEFCRHCGAEIPEGAQSCVVCGAPLRAPASDTASAEAALQLQPTSPNLAAIPVAPPSALQEAPTPPGADPAQSHYAPYPGTPGVWAPPGQPTYAPYPSYPSYPAQPGYQPYPQPGQVYGYPMGGGYYAPHYMAQPQPQRAPGETYALVISWIVTIASALGILGGLLVTALASIGVFTGQGDDLSFLGSIIGFSLAPILGGGFGLWYGILGILRRPSPRFGLPAAWAILILAVVAVGGGVALWQYDFSQGRAPGTAAGVLPLATLAGALPALAILAFTTQRLRNPSTRRHVWMSLFYGMTLAPLLAVIIETVLSLIIVAAFGLSAQDAQSVLGQPNTSNPSPTVVVAMLLVLSVVAPLVEEGVKPLAALLIIRRLRTPAEAFLVGLAAGVGFDILETIGYIGQGQADWVSVAIGRIGAGLLHGIGAGMAALGWYYLINGSGVHLRWLKGIGCGLYAVLQHALFNGFSLIGQTLPASANAWMNQPLYLGGLPLQNSDIIYLAIYLALLGMLIFMTSRLWRARGMPERKPPIVTPGWPTLPYGPYGPYAPYGYYAQYAPGAWPAPAPLPQTQQPLGGAR